MTRNHDFVIEEVHDLDTVWEELTALFQSLYGYHVALEERRKLRAEWESRWHDYLSLGEDRLILIASVSDKAAGYMNSRFFHDYGLFDETYGFIDDAFVTESARRLGIGSAMLQRTEDWCRQRGTAELRLSVAAANQAGVGFWTHAGFAAGLYQMSKSLSEARQ